MTKPKPTTKTQADPALLGMDWAKHSIHVHGVDAFGHRCLDKKMTTTALRKYLSNLAPCVVGMEACGRAHQWARETRTLGHEVRLVSPQFVKPFLMTNKNDRADAQAISETIQRPHRRFVGIKSTEQQAQQAVHRIRSLAVGQRTALTNQTRGLLAEFGIEIPQGRRKVRKVLPDLLGDGGTEAIPLDPGVLALLVERYEERVHLDERIDALNERIDRMARSNEQAKLLRTIPGIGPMTATALLSAMADPGVFKNGREFGAWLGLVPKQHSTGGKDRLLGISKRGDRYVRCLLVHGARAGVRARSQKDPTDARSRWLKRLLERRHKNVATVALANRMARTAWAVLRSGQPWQDNPVPA